jgi:hypothetical protein
MMFMFMKPIMAVTIWQTNKQTPCVGLWFLRLINRLMLFYCEKNTVLYLINQADKFEPTGKSHKHHPRIITMARLTAHKPIHTP